MTDDSATATSGGNPLLEAAHLAARRGWRVIPLHRVGGEMKACSCSKGLKCPFQSRGKHPLRPDWEKTPPMSGADVQDTWDREHPWNLGYLTGEPSGFWVLDIDPDNGGLDSAAKLMAEHGGMPATVVVQTGSGGWHYYFAMPPDFPVTNSRGRLKDYPGIDVRGTGGQVVAPPSRSAKGEYVLAADVDVIPQAPGWLLEMIRPSEADEVVTAEDVVKKMDGIDDAERERLARYEKIVVDREIARLDAMRAAATTDPSAYRGEPWNQTTFDVSATLIQLANAPWSALQPSDAYGIVFQHAPRDRDFDDEIVNRTFSSAAKKVGKKARDLPAKPASQTGTVYAGDPLSDPSAGTRPAAAPASSDGDVDGDAPGDPEITTFSWDDIGNARRLAARHGEIIRWVEQAGKWAVYRNGRWSLDSSQYVGGLAQQVLVDLRDEVTGYSGSLRPNFLKWAATQRMSARVAAMLREAQRFQTLQASISDFDVDPNLLNVANGIVDLRTGALRPHVAQVAGATDFEGRPVVDLLMQQSPVQYAPGSPTTLWQAFLDRVMPDKEMQVYLQMIAGYSLTGLTIEQAIFIHHGSGANGKSVWLEVMSKVVGDYGQVVPRATLLVSGSSDEHPTAIARQVGKRFLQASETAAGRRLDEEMVKGLTGGELQTARFMNQDFFDFKPTGKIHLVTNHLPRLTDAESIWRRLHLIGWREKIREDERDPYLAAKIISQESPGVLAWAVQGAVMWYAQGARLTKPLVSINDLTEYRADQDEFAEFIADRLERVPDHAGVRTSNAQLYDAFKSWSWSNGNPKPMRKQDFVRALGERGLERYRTATERGFAGVRVKPGVMDPLEKHL